METQDVGSFSTCVCQPDKHDLYRQHAPPRNHDRLIELVQHQVEHAMRMAVRIWKQQNDAA